ncbi:MAG: hypothetical protein M3Q56_02110 [Bacteroidota bacterium]|nr:hypothetical protein [Bacteroidota bacterium]
MDESKLQKYLSAKLYTNYDKRNVFRNSEILKQKDFHVGIQLLNKVRYYPKSEFFYGLAYLLNFSFDHIDFADLNKFPLEKIDNNSINIKIPLSIGMGRKYPIRSVHKAWWIYSELYKANFLARSVNDADIEQLAHQIDENTYTRFFDYRIKQMQHLIKTDSTLQLQKILNNQTITYFATLYDMYYYSSGFNRYRGKVLEAGLIGEYCNTPQLLDQKFIEVS